LATPLLVVFLSAALADPSSDSHDPPPSNAFASRPSNRCPYAAAVECLDSGKLPADALAAAEADTYWCLTKLLDNIQVLDESFHPFFGGTAWGPAAVAAPAIGVPSFWLPMIGLAFSPHLMRAPPPPPSSRLPSDQDHYTAGQPGLQRQIYKLEELARRIDPSLHRHLARHGIVFSMFSFRWMNNLLMRELPLQVSQNRRRRRPK
jgi:hypothetical protein